MLLFVLIPFAPRALMASWTERFGFSVRRSRMAWDLFGASGEATALAFAGVPFVLAVVAAISLALRFCVNLILVLTTDTWLSVTVMPFLATAATTSLPDAFGFFMK